MTSTRRLAAGLFLAASLLLSGEPAHAAGLKAWVSKAIGGKTMPGYQAVSGKRVKLTRPWRFAEKDEAAPSDGPSLSAGGVKYLDGKHYRDVRAMALKLMKKYDPRDHYYVAVGRSPTALATFLSELNPNMVMTFPASDLRLGVQAGWKEEFFDHFQQLIPDDVLRGERTIVLFDRSRDRSGTSLAALKRLLEEYLAKTNQKRVRVKAVGMAAVGPLAAGVEHMSTSRHPNVFQYFQGVDHDESFAPFKEKHRIGMEAMEDIQANPNYARLRAAMRARMARDASLREALSDDFGDMLGEP
jgi:hypothetical protein